MAAEDSVVPEQGFVHAPGGSCQAAAQRSPRTVRAAPARAAARLAPAMTGAWGVSTVVEAQDNLPAH